jgi:AcrR family transcriptional regulator
MPSPSSTGRRERKKAATRQSIADAALRLFLERGYDRVSIRDISDEADVSTTTLFKHFPGKEALVFDQEADIEARLVAVVSKRPADQGIVEALQHYMLSTPVVQAEESMSQFSRLVNSTPVLREYAERMWVRHTEALAAAIADELGVAGDDLACVTLARFVLEIPAIVRGRPDSASAVEEIFAILTNGWHEPPRAEAGAGEQNR